MSATATTLQSCVNSLHQMIAQTVSWCNIATGLPQEPVTCWKPSEIGSSGADAMSERPNHRPQPGTTHKATSFTSTSTINHLLSLTVCGRGNKHGRTFINVLLYSALWWKSYSKRSAILCKTHCLESVKMLRNQQPLSFKILNQEQWTTSESLMPPVLFVSHVWQNKTNAES